MNLDCGHWGNEHRLLWKFGGEGGVGGPGEADLESGRGRGEGGKRKERMPPSYPETRDHPEDSERPDWEDRKPGEIPQGEKPGEKAAQREALKKVREELEKGEKGKEGPKLKELEQMIAATGAMRVASSMDKTLIRDAEAHLKDRPPERKATEFADAGRVEREEAKYVIDPESADKRKKPDARQDERSELQSA